MKVVIICAFDTYFDRLKLLKEYYGKKHEVTVISSNFSHRKKSVFHSELCDIHIPVKEYHKNLSVDRLISHYQFSQKTYKILKQINPDIIHALIPANSLVKYLSKYKKEFGAKLYLDIIDLWPETLPVGNIKNHFPITMWRDIRDKYLGDADVVFTECQLFQTVLKKENDPRFHTLYWSRKERPLEPNYFFEPDQRRFCYLGSINNIIDIDLIVAFLKECNKYIKTTLHIIGNGEEKEHLIQQCKNENINIIDHEELYSQKEKQAIFDQCDFAFNVMKPSVVVGLTMKSLDYMCAGMPLINTIGGDTEKMCLQENIGYNLSKENVKETVQYILKETEQDILLKRNNIKDLYLRTFTDTAFFETLDKAGVLYG